MVINRQRPNRWGTSWLGERSYIDLFYIKEHNSTKVWLHYEPKFQLFEWNVARNHKNTTHSTACSFENWKFPISSHLRGCVVNSLSNHCCNTAHSIKPTRVLFSAILLQGGFDSDKRGVHTPKHVAQYHYSRKQYTYVLPHSKQEPNNADSIQRMCTYAYVHSTNIAFSHTLDIAMRVGTTANLLYCDWL